MSQQLLVIFILLSLFVSCAGIPHDISEAKNLTEPFGFCHAGRQGTEEEREYLKSLGVDWVRLDLSWSKVQREPGEFDFSSYDELFARTDASGVKVLGILSYDTPWIHEDPENKRQIDPEDFPAWLEFVSAAALRYGDRVGAFEIWNEPNFGRFWTGKDEDFFDLTKATVELLNRITPDTPVVVGSIIYNPFLGGPNYLRKFLASGAADGSDAISLHPYGVSPISAAQRMFKAREIMADYGFEGELWITEMGFPTGGSYPHAVDEELQGAYAAKTIASSFAAGVDRLIWYQLYDAYPAGETPSSASSEAYFGVAYPDGTLKNGGKAISHLVPRIRDASWAPELLDKKPPYNVPAAIYPFQEPDGMVTIVTWARIGRPHLILEGYIGDVEIYDTRSGEVYSADSGTVIQLTPEPLVITGDISGPIQFRSQ